MTKLHDLGARAARARIRSGGGGGTRRGLALLALALLAACSALAVNLDSSRAQYGRVPARVEIVEDQVWGSFGVWNYFIVYVNVYDADGREVHDPRIGVSWNPNAWTRPEVKVSQIYEIVGVTFGRALAVYQVQRPGPVTITATVGGSLSASVTLQLGEPAASQPPEPSSILLASPFYERLLRNDPDQVTVTALVTDANGATVPDGTPVEWETWRFHDKPHPTSEGENGRGWGWWIPISVDRTTTNGAATGTWRKRVPTNATGADDAVFVIARAGSAVGALVTAANRIQRGGATRPGAIEIIESPERWESVPVGEPVTLRARLTDRFGDPVRDNEKVYWRFHEYGAALATGKLEIVTRAASGGVNDTPTTNGVASATYTPRYPGTVWVRAYEISRRESNGVNHFLIDTVAFTVGDYYPPPEDLALNLRLLDDSDAVVPIGATLRVGAELTYSGSSEFEQALHITEGTLRMTQGLEWESGGGSLAAPGQSALTRRTVLLDHLAYHRGRTGRGAEGGRAEGQCKGFSDEGETEWTCAVDFGEGAAIVLPPGTEAGVYTISVVLSVNGREYRDTLDVTVVEPGSIDEVAEVRFGFAPRERGANRGEPYPSTLAAGESTRLRLTALNERGAASAAGSIASILFRTSAGSLSTTIGGGCEGGGGLICRIPIAAVTASNADKIDVTLTHPGAGEGGSYQGGEAQVEATLIAIDGEMFSLPSVGASLVGAAASLAISEPATSLLNAATGEDDDRDVLRLTVSAADEGGNAVVVPYRSPHAMIRNAAGATVSSGFSVVWTEDGDDADEEHDRFTRNAARAVTATIRATAEPGAPLAAGEYTLELRTAGQRARRTFTVVGPAAAIALSGPEGALQISEVASFTATVRDADGSPVPDGTRVRWSEEAQAARRTVLVQLEAETRTTEGKATASYLPVSSGSAVVAASAGDAREVALVEVAAASAAAASVSAMAALAPVEGLSEREPGSLTAWLGEGRTSASALLDGLEGVDSILLWQYGRWLRYGRSEGRVIPGSIDFVVTAGAILWLGD